MSSGTRRQARSLGFAVCVLLAAAPSSGAAKDTLFDSGKIVILGEVHGTVESPAFVLGVARRVAGQERPVVVAIELPTDEQARVDAYIESEGTTPDRAALLGGPAWIDPYQYGVTSAAVFDLIEGLRALRASGHEVTVVLFNRTGERQTREREMADLLAEVARATDPALMLILTGNLHSRVRRGVPGDAGFQPLGRLLGQRLRGARLASIDVAHRGGEVWICSGPDAADCGVQKVDAHGPQGSGVELGADVDRTRHHGWYHVGELHPSPPAVAPQEKR